MISKLTTNQNSPDFEELEHLERQTTTAVHTCNKKNGVDDNIVSIIVIILGVNRPLQRTCDYL